LTEQSESGVPAGYDGDFDPAPNNVGESVAWNAQDPAPPFIPLVVGCNPTAP
jgi:hypothetical protein